MTTRTTTRRRNGFLAAAALLALAAAACTGGGASSPAPASAVPSSGPSAEARASGAPTALPSPSLYRGRVDLTPVPGTTEGGVPADVVQAAVDDAAARAGVEAAVVTVVSAEAATWPSGALGCPKMGVMYTDVITPGYHVVVEAGGTTYDYRASRKGGDARLCENPPGPG